MQNGSTVTMGWVQQILIPYGARFGASSAQPKLKFSYGVLYMVLYLLVALENEHMKLSGQCPACNMGTEDIKYLLFQYSKARSVRRYMGIDDVIHKACQEDRPSETMLSSLLSSPANECSVLGLGVFSESIVVGTW